MENIFSPGRKTRSAARSSASETPGSFAEATHPVVAESAVLDPLSKRLRVLLSAGDVSRYTRVTYDF